jgi:Domain of unknown function (DUF4442)
MHKILKNNIRLAPKLVAASVRCRNSLHATRSRLARCRCADETSLVEPKLCRHALRRLYAMTDSFYMVMLLENLGRGYIVWHKSASIRFRRPGRGTERAEFRLTQERINETRHAIDKEGKVEREFAVEVKDRGQRHRRRGHRRGQEATAPPQSRHLTLENFRLSFPF